MAQEKDRFRGLDAAESEALFYAALPGPARPVERVERIAALRPGPGRTPAIGVNIGGPYNPAFTAREANEREAAPARRAPQFPADDAARKPQGRDFGGQDPGHGGSDDGILAVAAAPGCVIGGDARWAGGAGGKEGGGLAPAAPGSCSWSDGHDGTVGNRGAGAAAHQAGRRDPGRG